MAEDIKDRDTGNDAGHEAGTDCPERKDGSKDINKASSADKAANSETAPEGSCDSGSEEAVKGRGQAVGETCSDAGSGKTAESGTASAKTPNDADNPAGDEKNSTSGKPGAADAKDAKDAKPDRKDHKIAELNDRYLRLFAEFDNFRKRSEAEKGSMFSEGEKTVLLKVLPLIDNFERALGTLSEEDQKTPFAEGIEKVYRAFMDQLKQFGVRHIEAVGKEFDASLHNAVMHVDDDSQGENIVVEEFQKGYMFGDKVLRYSMVKVAN